MDIADVKLPRVDGSVEFRLFAFKFKFQRFCNKPTLEGILPSKLFENRAMEFRFVSCPIDVGIVPNNWLLPSCIEVIATKLPMLDGRVPTMPFPFRLKRSTRRDDTSQSTKLHEQILGNGL